jgi:hypothetical protein
MRDESSIEKKRVLFECTFAKLEASQVYTLQKKLKNVVSGVARVGPMGNCPLIQKLWPMGFLK